MKRIITILFVLTLFLLASCGIPYIYLVESSDYSISRSGNITTFKLNSNLQQIAFQEGSPEINLVYVVKPTDYTTNYSSLISAFNANYSVQTGSIRYNDEPFYKEYNKINYGIFPVQLSNRINANSFIDYSCKIQFELDDELKTIDIVLNDQFDNSIQCSRYNLNSSFNGCNSNADGVLFIGNEIAEELSENIIADSYSIEIYAFISMDIGGDYNNIYNTPLKLVFSFEV